jgi:hypothetical protein
MSVVKDAIISGQHIWRIIMSDEITILKRRIAYLEFENAEIKGMSRDVIGSLVDKAKLVAENFELRETVRSIESKWDRLLSFIYFNSEPSIDKSQLNSKIAELNAKYCVCHIGSVCGDACKTSHHSGCSR